MANSAEKGEVGKVGERACVVVLANPPVMGVWLLRAAIFGLPTPIRGAPTSRGHDVTVVTGL